MPSRAFVNSSNQRVLNLPNHTDSQTIRAVNARRSRELRADGIIRRDEDPPYICIDRSCGAVMYKGVRETGTHYLAHSPGTKGTCTGESLRHSTAKIVTLKFLDGFPQVDYTEDEYTVQTSSGIRRADGFVKFDTGEEYYLEIVHTHHPDDAVVEEFGEKMLVLDLGPKYESISDDDVYNDIVPAYFAQAVLNHQQTIREIKNSNKIDSDLFILSWKGDSLYSTPSNFYSRPLLDTAVTQDFFCKICNSNQPDPWSSVMYSLGDGWNGGSEEEEEHECLWAWSLGNGLLHDIGNEIPTEIDVSGWSDVDEVKEKLCSLQHYRFHIEMGDQSAGRVNENEKVETCQLQTGWYRIRYARRPEFCFLPLLHDFGMCNDLSEVRDFAHKVRGFRRVKEDPSSFTGIDKYGYRKSEIEKHLNEYGNRSYDVDESIEDLNREIDHYHQKMVQDNRIALGILENGGMDASRAIKERLEDRWGLTDHDVETFLRWIYKS